MPAFGQLLSDATGLVQRLDVEVGGHAFEIKTVSNYDIIDHEFDKDEKRLTIFIDSGLENNLGEINIPQTLLSGNFTFYLNDVLYDANVKSNERISFITLNFTGSGNHQLDIFGTTSLEGIVEEIDDVSPPNLTPSVDYDYELIYSTTIVILIVGGIIAAIILVKRKKH